MLSERHSYRDYLQPIGEEIETIICWDVCVVHCVIDMFLIDWWSKNATT